MTLLPISLCPQSHGPVPSVLAMPLLDWQDPSWAPSLLISGYTGISMTTHTVWSLEPRMKPPCVPGTLQPSMEVLWVFRYKAGKRL